MQLGPLDERDFERLATVARRTHELPDVGARCIEALELVARWEHSSGRWYTPLDPFGPELVGESRGDRPCAGRTASAPNIYGFDERGRLVFHRQVVSERGARELYLCDLGAGEVAVTFEATLDGSWRGKPTIVGVAFDPSHRVTRIADTSGGRIAMRYRGHTARVFMRVIAPRGRFEDVAYEAALDAHLHPTLVQLVGDGTVLYKARGAYRRHVVTIVAETERLIHGMLDDAVGAVVCTYGNGPERLPPVVRAIRPDLLREAIGEHGVGGWEPSRWEDVVEPRFLDRESDAIQRAARSLLPHVKKSEVEAESELALLEMIRRLNAGRDDLPLVYAWNPDGGITWQQALLDGLSAEQLQNVPDLPRR